MFIFPLFKEKHSFNQLYDWQGNSISCMKTFGKLNCKLCMKERINTLKMSQENPERLINSCGKIYGACRHRTRFHRFIREGNYSTDDAITQKKVSNVCNLIAKTHPSQDPPSCENVTICIPILQNMTAVHV